MGEGANMGVDIAMTIVYLLIAVVLIVSYWKIFTKAGKPGWASIVPIYNSIVLLEIVKKPVWWIVLFFVPCANIVALVLVSLEFVKVFGKPSWHAALFILLGIVYAPYIAFSDAKYVG